MGRPSTINNSKWINFKAFPPPKDGDPLKKKVKIKMTCFCDCYKVWGVNPRHAFESCRRKNITSNVNLQVK